MSEKFDIRNFWNAEEGPDFECVCLSRHSLIFFNKIVSNKCCVLHTVLITFKVYVIIFCIIPFQHVTFCLNNKYILYNELVIIKCFKGYFKIL